MCPALQGGGGHFVPDTEVYHLCKPVCTRLSAMHPGADSFTQETPTCPGAGTPQQRRGLGLSTPARKRPGRRCPGTRSGQWPGLRNLLSLHPTPKEGGRGGGVCLAFTSPVSGGRRRRWCGGCAPAQLGLARPGAVGTGKAAGWRTSGLGLHFRGREGAGAGEGERCLPPRARSPGRPVLPPERGACRGIPGPEGRP